MSGPNSSFGTLAMNAGEHADIDPVAPWSFTLGRGRGELNALRTEWGSCLERQATRTYLQSPEWISSYLHALAPQPEQVVFVAARIGRRLAGVVALERVSLGRHGLAIPALRLVTGEHMHLSDLALPTAGDQFLAALTHWLSGRRELAWQVIVGEGVSSDSLLGQSLHAEAGGLHHIVRPQPRTVWLDCSGNVESALERTGRSHRQNVKRLLRRARDLGDLSYEAVTQSDRLDKALDDFLQVECSGWKVGTGTAIRQCPELLRFYRRLVHEFGARGACRINLLRLNGVVVAGQFGLVSNGQLNLLKIGYSSEHAHLGPGHLIMQHTIESVCADPLLTRLSFVTNPAWAQLWKPHTTEVNCHLLFRNGLMGGLLYWAARAWFGLPRRKSASRPQPDAAAKA